MIKLWLAIGSALKAAARSAAAASASPIQQSLHLHVPAFASDLGRRRTGHAGEPRVSRFIAVLSLAMVMGGCASGTAVSSPSNPTPGPSASTSSTTPAGSPGGAALPAELTGTWSVLLGQADVAAIAIHVPGFDSAGVWTLTLSANTFQMFNPEEFTAGPVAAGIDAGKHLVVADDPACPDQVLLTGGVYTYQASATSLTFSPGADDACPFRGWLLRAKPWTKAP